MPITCVAYNCKNRYSKGSDITFHKFPQSNQSQRAKWVNAVRRRDWHPTIYSYLCSDHFEKKFFKYNNDRRYLMPNAVPTQFDFSQNRVKRKYVKKLITNDCKKAKIVLKADTDTAPCSIEDLINQGIISYVVPPSIHHNNQTTKLPTWDHKLPIKNGKNIDKLIDFKSEEDVDDPVAVNISSGLSSAKLSISENLIKATSSKKHTEKSKIHKSKKELLTDDPVERKYIEFSSVFVGNESESLSDNPFAGVKISVDAQTQTDITMWDLKQSEESLIQANSTIYELRKKLNRMIMDESSLKDEPEKVRYYTGLPGISTLTAISKLLNQMENLPRAMTIYQLVLLTLMKLRLNLPIRDLGYRFSLSQSTATRLYGYGVDILYDKLSCLVQIPDREDLVKNISSCCIERASAKPGQICLSFEPIDILVYPSQGLHSVDKYNEEKLDVQSYLLGVLPQGVIAFVFKDDYNKRLSHEHLYSGGILEQLEEGDVIIASHGFDTDEDVSVSAVEVIRSKEGEKQLSAVEDFKSFKHFRVHTMKVGSIVKNKYSILSSPVMKEKGVEKNSVYVDKVLCLCCALTNLSHIPVDDGKVDN